MAVFLYYFCFLINLYRFLMNPLNSLAFKDNFNLCAQTKTNASHWRGRKIEKEMKKGKKRQYEETTLTQQATEILHSTAHKKTAKTSLIPEKKEDPVKIKEFSKFLNVKLKHENNGETYLHRFQKLQKYCSSSISKDKEVRNFHMLWLEVRHETKKTLWLNFLLFESENYESRAVRRNDLSILKNDETDAEDTVAYDYIKLFEGEDVSKEPLLQIRIDKSGKLGEILFIRGTESIKGTDIKKLSMALIEFLQIECVILQDTAKLEKKGEALLLKKFLPIVSEDAKTWYEREGFRPLSCEAFKVVGQESDKLGRNVSQNPQTYSSAIAKIRKTRLEKLLSFFAPETKQKKCLISLTKKYSLNFNSSLHDLGKAIYLSKNLNDLENFCRNFLTVDISSVDAEDSAESAAFQFNSALEIMDDHLLFERRLLT